MKSKFSIALTLLLIFSASPAIADPPAPAPESGVSLNPRDKVNLGGKCEGTTDIPHESHHVVGTVNVLVRTECKGQTVTVGSIMTRISLNDAPYVVSNSKSGRDKVEISLSMPCTWKPGHPAILYLVSSFHMTAGQDFKFTRNFKFLKC